MQMFNRARFALEVLGPRGLVQVVLGRVSGRPLAFAPQIAETVVGASVLEVGGPSGLFRASGLVPVYNHAASVDNVNYAGATLWESGLTDGGDFAPEGLHLGTQWLREATDLDDLGPYDVVISSHTIEHTANPLKALREWRRVCKDGGALVMVLPHRDGTFDHRRSITSLDHLREDERAEAKETDDTHIAEILELHDVSRDPGLSSMEQLRDRVEDNVTTRAMHHHVFSTRSALDMVKEAGWVPEAAQAVWQHDIVILARNGGVSQQVTLRSPFPSDRT